jgi:hypothetical protein
MRDADEQIDGVLLALNAAEVPARLEQRVMARVAQRSAEASASEFAGWRVLMARLSPYAVGAAVAVLVFAAYVGLSHRAPRAVEQVQVRRDVVMPKNSAAGLTARVVHSAAVRGAAAEAVTTPTAAAEDSDAVALAETMAPSHPAPLMAATPQELLAMRSGRAGHSVEMAELQPHEPGFRTEHERTAIRQYILGLLDPLVTAQNLTSSPPPADDPPAPPASTDTTSTN